MITTNPQAKQIIEQLNKRNKQIEQDKAECKSVSDYKICMQELNIQIL